MRLFSSEMVVDVTIEGPTRMWRCARLPGQTPAMLPVIFVGDSIIRKISALPPTSHYGTKVL